MPPERKRRRLLKPPKFNDRSSTTLKAHTLLAQTQAQTKPPRFLSAPVAGSAICNASQILVYPARLSPRWPPDPTLEGTGRSSCDARRPAPRTSRRPRPLGSGRGGHRPQLAGSSCVIRWPTRTEMGRGFRGLVERLTRDAPRHATHPHFPSAGPNEKHVCPRSGRQDISSFANATAFTIQKPKNRHEQNISKRCALTPTSSQLRSGLRMATVHALSTVASPVVVRWS